MFLISTGKSNVTLRFPHAGGDVSGLYGRTFVALTGFPHAGGDVSTCYGFDREVVGFSPRRWGCFLLYDSIKEDGYSFPHAGGDVFELRSTGS